MDQLSLHSHTYELSPLFASKYKTYQIFTTLAENQFLLIIITSHLEISDILSLATTSKYLKNLIENNTKLYNRILKAQVKYLTTQQELRMQNSKLNNFYKDPTIHSANSWLQYYQIKNQYYSFKKVENTKANTKPQNIKAQKSKADKQKQNKNLQQKKEFYKQYQEIIKNDPQVRMLTQLSEKAAARQAKQRQFKSLMQNKSQISQAQINYSSQYPQVAMPDESLIVAKVTFWDRIKQKFINRF